MVSAPEVASSQVEERQGVVATAADMDPLVVSAFNDAVGRVSIITTVDGKRFNGYVGSIGFDDNIMSLATYWTTEITDRNRANLMRCESETTEKVTFKFDDIVDIQVLSHDGKGQKLASKFVTDRVYHGESLKDDEDLQEWCGGEDEDGIGGSIEDQEPTNNQHNRRNNQNNGPGWSAADMFAANEKHVFSTFKEDLTQYTTVEVTGTDEDRARAERLAREIESNQTSKFYANLENDDVERDLDKTTREDDFEYNGRRRGNNSYSQQSQQRRNQNPNITPNGQPVNRRAEGLRSDRRSSNSTSNSANNSRYGAGQSQNYVQQGAKGGYGNNRPRQNEEYRENDWSQQMAKGKGQSQSNEQSFRHQPKQMLDPRIPKQVEGDKTSNSRVAGLKSWGTDFAIATSPKEQSPAPSQGNSAWNRGPPTSLVGKGSSSTESTPPPEDLETPSNELPQTTSSKSEKREDVPSTSSEVQDETDGKQNEGDDMSTTGASETSSASKSFKFNINAPEFKPRVAPTTPTPTTPTGPTPQNEQIPPHQFVPHEYQQQQQPQQHPGMAMQGAPMGMPGSMVHMVPGAVPTSQNQHVVMWPPGHQGYPPNQQYPMQPVAMPGVPGQMYGPGATAPATVQNAGNQQIVNPAAGGAPVDGRQQNAPVRRDGEHQACFYPYTQNGPVIQNMPPNTFYQPQYQPMAQGQYPIKMVPPQGAQGYQRQFQQQVFVQRYPGQPHQQPPPPHFVNEQAGAPQSHPNSQPTTPGPRGEQNAPKQGQQQQPQNGNNVTEGRSSASLSGSASSQSGQRCGSPQNGAPQQQQQPQQQQPPPQQQQQQMPPQHGVHPQGQMVMPQGYMMMQGGPPMHQHAPYYHQQQNMYNYVMVPQPIQMPQNQHISDQQSVMGERADQGFPQSNIFDYRMYQHQQQQQQQHAQQQHGGHMPRQNSIPQPFNGGQVLKV